MGLLDFDVNKLAGNPLLNMGLGILANNSGNYGQFAPAFGKGTQQGLQNAQAFQQNQQENEWRKKQIDMQQAQFDMLKAKNQREIDLQAKKDAAMPRLLSGDASYQSMQNNPVTSYQNIPITTREGMQAPNFGLEKQSINTMQQMPVIDNSKRMQDYVDAGLGDEILKAQILKQFAKHDPIKLGKDETLLDPSTYKPLASGVHDKEIKNGYLIQDASGNWVIDQTLYNAEKGLKRAGASNVSVNNKLDLKTGEGLAKEIGPMISASKAAAEGANQTFSIADRIDNAIASKKLIAGPLSNQRVQLLQAGQILGINGKDDTETLSNTRDAIQGLAQFTLSGRSSLKGQGQISDYEGKLLARATSGDITDLTIPELKVISDAAKRVAKAQQETHSRNMQIMRNKPELSDVADFYDVPSYQPPKQDILPKSSMMQKPKSKQFAIEGGKRVLGVLGADGNYYVTQGGKKYRVDE